MLNFGYWPFHSVRKVIEAVKRISGVNFDVRLGSKRAGDPAKLVVSNDKLKAAFGWVPRCPSLDAITCSGPAWEK